MAGYYDIVLGLIPLSLAGLTALLLFAGMSLSTAVPLASVVSIGLMGHAMFVNAPLGPQPAEAAAPNSNDVVSAE
ncbi:MAG: hypothetical protein ACI8UR_000299 [Natronomonas sp.]|jgi:hypothetical protein|uniref:hypothetical protein n=1 Tax=Natronomonas sp. TaxID=2184060 RepID=UPI0039891767